jgi:hypothetical protein
MIFWLLLTLPFVADRQAATDLLDQVDYFSYERICQDLKQLHTKLLVYLGDNEVVYSKTYVAKSGDLISYFYRVLDCLF